MALTLGLVILQPCWADPVTEEIRDGGVSIRRSLKVMVNFGGARRVVLSSDPGGLFASQVSYPEVNSTFSTSNLQGSNGGYVFSPLGSQRTKTG